jgi:hypothetical protein
MLTEQGERAAGLDDEQAWPVDRRHLLQQVDQQCRLARTGRAEDQHVGVLLAVFPVQWIEDQRLGTPVEEHQARMTGATRSTIDRQQVRGVAREHQA